MVRRMAAHATLAALILASLLVAEAAGPREAQAAHGEKWWNPARGERRVERVQRPVPRRFTRQWRTWGGRRIYRDVIVIRSGHRGPGYRAWRAYSRPQYIYSRRVIRVRPVRFYVAASVVIGGVHVRGAWHDDDDYLYGCNFCEARFDDYSGYHDHVRSCAHRPGGYRVECSDWDAPSSGDWWEDRDWHEDEGRYDRDRDRWDDWSDRDDERWEDDEGR